MGLAPTYLTDSLQHVADLPGRQRSRSASSADLAVPQTRLQTVGDKCRQSRKSLISVLVNIPGNYSVNDCTPLSVSVIIIFAIAS